LSAWWLLIAVLSWIPSVAVNLIDEDSFLFFPLFGLSIMLSLGTIGFGIYFLSSRGTIGPNNFGPDPLDRVLDERITHFWSRFFSSMKSGISTVKGNAVAASTQLQKAANEISNPIPSSSQHTVMNPDERKATASEDPNVILLRRLAKMKADGILSDEEFALAEIQFNIQKDGNWEHGYNILHQPLAPLQVLEKSGLTAAEYHPRLHSIKQKIKRYQDSRIRPSFDDKAICSWNALYLKALADAALFLQNINYSEKAISLADWMWLTFWQNNELLRIHRNGITKISGFLEDYACFCEGLLSAYTITKNEDYLVKAEILIQKSIELFYNPQTQQLAFTPDNG
jgi:hypothetical protein